MRIRESKWIHDLAAVGLKKCTGKARDCTICASPMSVFPRYRVSRVHEDGRAIRALGQAAPCAERQPESRAEHGALADPVQRARTIGASDA